MNVSTFFKQNYIQEQIKNSNFNLLSEKNISFASKQDPNTKQPCDCNPCKNSCKCDKTAKNGQKISLYS